MRSSQVLSFAVLTLSLSTCAYSQTQFKQPTPEELKMTADPKAPGADVVYLNVEEISNDPLHYQTYYARIKVLTEKGKDLATVEVPYLRGRYTVREVKARTIHADGKVIPLEGKPEDLLVSKKGDREVGRKVFNLPSVEVGSILEYRYQIDYDENHFSSPMWEIQRHYFVHSAHYQFTPFKSFMPGSHEATSQYLIDGRGRTVNTLIWWGNLPEGNKIESNAGGFYTVDVKDIPPIPDEEYMPPIDSFLYKVFFYYKSAGNATDFWISEAKEWSKDVDKFAEQSKTIREAVAGLIAPTDKEEDKARKLYAAVQALDNTDYSRKKGESELKQLKLKEAKHVEDTWKQKSGDSEDIAMLYLAMARSAGLAAYAIKVVSRSRGVFDVTYMDLDQLNDTLVLLGIDGKPVLVDPGEKMCSFGTVNWRHSGTGGLRQSSEGPGYAATPQQAYAANSTKRTASLAIDAHGEVTGLIRIVTTGQESLKWRQRALEIDETELKKEYDKSLEGIVPDGVEAHVDHFLGIDDPDVVLMAVANVKGTLGTSTSKRLLLPGTFFESRQRLSFVSAEKRQESVDMHYADRLDEEVTYRLPEGVVVEGAPKDSQIPWQGHAVYGLKTTTQPGVVTVNRQIVRAFSLAKPEEYQDLRSFYQKVTAADQQQLVLTSTAQPAQAAKGN
jgi:transglutaminase-like putative cysteine protease